MPGLCLKNEAYTLCRAPVPLRGSYRIFAKKDDVYTVCGALVASRDLIRVRNCAFMVANATKNLVLATRI